jgi:hypothetical protein
MRGGERGAGNTFERGIDGLAQSRRQLHQRRLASIIVSAISTAWIAGPPPPNS